MKKICSFLFLILFVFTFVSPVLAAQSQPTFVERLTYAQEWVHLNLLTWSKESKVKVLGSYALDYVKKIDAAVESNQTAKAEQLSQRYQNLKQNQNQIIETTNLKNEIIEAAKNGLIEEQKVLSQTRQQTANEKSQKEIANLQQNVVNQTKKVITGVEGKEEANNLVDQVVSVWRDPQNEVKEEKVSRVFAPGTTGQGNDGVVIDAGQAIIRQDKNENLKIEYAPGTGPNSVTGESGTKLWKIQLSNGQVVESYTAGSTTVIGEVGEQKGNVIVNTVSGQQSAGSPQVVVGNDDAPAGRTIQDPSTGKTTVTEGKVVIEDKGNVSVKP